MVVMVCSLTGCSLPVSTFPDLQDSQALSSNGPGAPGVQRLALALLVLHKGCKSCSRGWYAWAGGWSDRCFRSTLVAGASSHEAGLGGPLPRWPAAEQTTHLCIYERVLRYQESGNSQINNQQPMQRAIHHSRPVEQYASCFCDFAAMCHLLALQGMVVCH